MYMRKSSSNFYLSWMFTKDQLDHFQPCAREYKFGHNTYAVHIFSIARMLKADRILPHGLLGAVVEKSQRSEVN